MHYCQALSMVLTLIALYPQSTKVGHVAEVHRTIAQLSLENEQLQYVSRDRCFVYGVCLEKVELWHVLSIGESMKGDNIFGMIN